MLDISDFANQFKQKNSHENVNRPTLDDFLWSYNAAEKKGFEFALDISEMKKAQKEPTQVNN